MKKAKGFLIILLSAIMLVSTASSAAIMAISSDNPDNETSTIANEEKPAANTLVYTNEDTKEVKAGNRNRKQSTKNGFSHI